MRSFWIIQWALNPVISVLILHTEKRLMEIRKIYEDVGPAKEH